MEGPTKINHFAHNHPLKLFEGMPDNFEVAERLCNGCHKLIQGKAYRCVVSYGCRFKLHKRCAELPKEIKYHGHSQHLLTLYSHPPNNDKTCVCKICQNKEWKWFTYSCSPCQFNVDVLCAFTRRPPFMHESHQHPLIFVPNESSFRCDACCQTNFLDFSYLCTTCGYWIHSLCAWLPSSIKSVNHDHTLVLAYSLPQEYQKFEFPCDICREELNEASWVYYCAKCRFFSHIKCATSEKKLRGLDAAIEYAEPSLLHLPMAEGSLDVHLINKCMELITQEKYKEETEFIHFSHDHPLIIFDEKNSLNDDDMIKKNIGKILCKACVQPILAVPFYGCFQCSFFLHKTCAMLPVEMNRKYDERRLQTTLPFFKCDRCGKLSTGFSYYSGRSHFDVVCAFLPNKIKHKAHKHPLPEYVYFGGKCSGCGDERPNSIKYGCQDCRFNLERYCCNLPQKVKHEWDRHPLELSYPPFSDHPDEFICEICEEDIHPKHWLYHCRICDQSFHTKCVCMDNKYSNIQFGSSIVLVDHPHALKFVRNGKNKSPCIRCGKICPVLECGECNFYLCAGCMDCSFIK